MPSFRSIAATAFASELAKLLGLLALAAAIFAGVMWYVGRDDRQRERDKEGEKRFQDTTAVLRRDSAKLDTAKRAADAAYIATIGALQREIDRIRRARPAGDTVVSKRDFDTIVRACTETLPTACELKVKARDSIIANRDATIAAWKARPPVYRPEPRFNLTAAIMADVDSVKPFGRLDADLRIRGHVGIMGTIEAGRGTGTRKSIGVRYRF